MNKLVRFTAKLLIVSLGSFALSACGDILKPEEEGLPTDTGSATDRVVRGGGLNAVVVEEKALRANPECGEASEEFLPRYLK